MNKKLPNILVTVLVLAVAWYFLFNRQTNQEDAYISYQVNLQEQDLKLYWRDDKEQLFRSLGNLKAWLNTRGERLIFAMNGGMFKDDNSPQGLFIQEGKIITPLDTSTGSGNFYLKPNGVFFITINHQGYICPTDQFTYDKSIRYATQSGPMLLVEGKMHPAFRPGSVNVNIRNGVGILPNGNLVFAMSKQQVNFCDFANYFKQLGCRQALYLDGFVSRTYLPQKQWVQTDGDFGVMLAVTEKK